jgi:tetratricopeptide (TPR) repeat protein
MFSALILAATFGVFTDETVTALPTADLAAYKNATAKVDKTADAHVRLALWCEAHGMTAERLKHLSLAVLYDPTNVLARGLMGLVAYHGKWGRPDVIGQQIQNDPAHQAIVKEYLDRRARAPDKADAQMKLAAWCDEKGLKEQALAHYSAVTRINPSRDSAWKHLGYKKQGDRWVKPDEAAAAKQEAARQKQADKHWKTKLERLRDGLESKDAARRTKAEQGVTEVTDPRAVPMIWAIFVRGGERLQIAAVQMLGQIDGPSASNALAAIAVFSPAAEARRRAIETLTRRDPRDFVGRLVGMIRKPFKYEVRRPNGPRSPGELFVEGERYNIRRFYQNESRTDAIDRGRLFFTPDVPFNPFSLQNLALGQMLTPIGPLMATAGAPFSFSSVPFSVTPSSAGQFGQAIAANPQNAAAVLHQLANNPANQGAQFAIPSALLVAAAQRDILIGLELENIRLANQDLEQKLVMDVQTLEITNAGISFRNDRTLPVLTATTGRDLGVAPEQWKGWWSDQLGYAYQSELPESKPTLTDFVNIAGPIVTHSCFGAGTLVNSSDGKRPIESIRIGDRVLSQNTVTGLLTFQPVLAVYHNRPSPTLRIATDGEMIIATGIHRFWKAGLGWTMARELKPGDRLRVLNGVGVIRSVEAEKIQPVFNLEVAGNQNFFVGTDAILVHDNSFVQPVLEPFDREPVLGSLAPASK